MIAFLTKESIFALVGCILLTSINATVYLWSTISIYVSSYYRSIDTTVSVSQMLAFAPIRGSLLLFLIPFGSKFYEKYGIRKSIIIASITFTLPLIVASFTKNSIIFTICFAISYTFITGFGIGALYGCTWRYFPFHKELATGIISFGMLLGCFYSYLPSLLVNPKNVDPQIIVIEGQTTYHYFQDDISKKVPFMMKTLTLIFGIVLLLCSLFMKEPSEQHLELIEKNMLNIQTNKSNNIEHEIPISNLIFSKYYFMMLTIYTFGTYVDVKMAFSGKEIGLKNGYDDNFLSLGFSLCLIIQAICRPSWSFLSKKMDPFYILYCGIAMEGIIFGFINVLALEKYLYLISVLIFSCFSSTIYIAIPIQCANKFGPKLGSILNSYLVLAWPLAFIFIFSIDYFILPKIGYSILTKICFIFSIICLYLLYYLKADDMKKTENPDIELKETFK